MGEEYPNKNTLVLLSDIFDIPLEELLNVIEKQTKNTIDLTNNKPNKKRQFVASIVLFVTSIITFILFIYLTVTSQFDISYMSIAPVSFTSFFIATNMLKNSRQ